MLVLSRRRNEAIIIEQADGSVIRFVVADIRGDKVRIGVEALPEIPVWREEIHRARQEEAAVA